MFGFKKIAMPTAAEALPGRNDPIRTAADPLRQRPRAERALSGGLAKGHVRARLLLGRREKFLGIGRWRLCNRGRLCRRADAESDLRGSLLGPHRPQRSRVGRLRSEEDFLRDLAQDFLGRPRPDAGHASGHTTSAPSIAPASTPSRPSRRRRPRRRRRCTRRSSPRKATAPSPPRSSMRPSSISPRTITSSIWRRIRFGYCGHGGTGVSCPIGTGAKLTQAAGA